MREIQDMTLNTRRGLERVETTLRDRSDQFVRQFHRLATPEDAFGIRLTGIPTGEDIRFEKVFQNNSIVLALDKPRVRIFRRYENGDQQQVLGLQEIFGLSPHRWRPMLRATRAEDCLRISDTSLRNIYYLECHSNGIVEFGLVSVRMRDATLGFASGPIILPAGSPAVEFMNLAIWIDHIRNAASSPTSEFAIEVEIRVVGDSVPVAHNEFERFGEIRTGLTFPRYSFVDSEEIPMLAAVFETDFWHSLGRDVGRLQGTLVIEAMP